MGELIYHICRKDEWFSAKTVGIYNGSSQDKRDGFIHFSSFNQLEKSAAKHRAGQDGLVLLTVDTNLLGELLKWEPSREGKLFPHLYGNLPLVAVVKEQDLELGSDGFHIFSDLM